MDQPPPDESGTPELLPTWTNEEERGLWLDMLDSYSVALIGQQEDILLDRRDAVTLAAVKLAARCADSALREYQFRQMYQSSQPGQSADADFENFTEWLKRRAMRRKQRKSTTQQRRSIR